MRKTLVRLGAVLTLVLVTAAAPLPAPDPYTLIFSTYVGGSQGDLIRGIAVDRQGNIHVAGVTDSPNFPTTPGAYQRTYGGNGDAFVAKFSPTGQLIWSTFFGGPNYDQAYAIEVDNQGYVYIAGRAGDGFPTTPGVLQPNFGRDVVAGPNALYGKQDGGIAKFTSDGALVWSTYFGGDDEGFIRDIDVDNSGNVYVIEPVVTRPFPYITAGAFQTRLQGGFDMVVAKISPDARQVIWASYLGGSGDDGGGPSLRVDKATGEVYALGVTNSPDFPTPNGFKTYLSGQQDVCLAKFTADGSRLIFGTYLGGSGDEGLETHNIALDASGKNIYVAHYTSSTDIPMVGNGFQQTFRGGGSEVIVWKISSGGQLLANTYLGGKGGEGVQGIAVGTAGNVYLSIPGTTSTDFPVTSNAYQSTNRGGTDAAWIKRLIWRLLGRSASGGNAAWVKLSPDLSRLLYSTYLGGSGQDEMRCAALDPQGCFVFAGMTNSRDFPTLNAFQRLYAGGNLDAILAKFCLSGSGPGSLTPTPR